MKNNLKKRLLAAALAVCTILGMGIPASAASIADGSKTCTVALAPVHTYLQTTAGTWLRACGYDYTTNDGLTGPAYCIDHGLAYTGKVLPITGKYEASAKTAGAFANGYPQHSLDTFLGLHLAGNPVLAGLTEYEYRYATQVAVWATLGQLAVDGTEFTSGRERLARPSGDLQQERVFCAVQVILDYAKNWDRIYKTGMYIRTQENALGGNTALPPNMTLEAIANENIGGIRLETIGGVTYYTKEYYVASATSTYPQGYTIDLWTTGAPAGTKFVDERNVELTRSKWHETDTWRLPVSVRDTNLNYNDFEYSGKVKLCIPADNAPPRGEITIHSAAQMIQYEIYLANNDTASEQSYIIADPAKGAIDAEAVLSWGDEDTEYGRLKVTKVGGGSSPLEGAIFVLTGTDGTRRTGKTDKKGEILWEKLSPTTHYTLSEQTPPPGYSAVGPIDLTVKAGQITYLTVRDDPQHTITVHKQDWQSGYSLRGAVIRFEQIDGSFVTTATTDHAGNIQFNADQLPLGSYRVFEEAAPEGYEVDPTPQTVHWDGKQDVTITFRNVRKPTLILSKKSSSTGYNLPGAVLDVYRDGTFVTTVVTNDAGLAYVPGVVSGSYYTVIERTAPEHHLLDETAHGIYINTYNPATTDDPRLVVMNDPMPSLQVVKYDRISHTGMAKVTYEIFRDGISLGRFETDKTGEILLQHIEPGTYRVVEVDTGDDEHLLDATAQEIELRAGDGIRELVFFNDRKPGLWLEKVDSIDLSKPIPNAVFEFTAVDGSYGPKEFTTDKNGQIDLSKLPATAMVVTEKSCPGYVVDDGQRIIQLRPNTTAQFVFTNTKLPTLTLHKTDADDGATPVPDTIFQVRAADGSTIGEYKTGADGTVKIEGLQPQVVEITEKSVPSPYLLDAPSQIITLFPGQDAHAYFSNHKAPVVEIIKENSITHDRLPHVKMQVWYASNNTATGELNDLGVFITDKDGRITLTGPANGLRDGWFRVKELEPLAGYGFKGSDTQEAFVEAGKTHTFLFQNVPLSALVVWKSDAVNGAGLGNCTFRLRYLGGDSSGSSGTVIGTYTTSDNGSFTVTGLKAGYYICEEISSDSSHVIDSAPQSFYISGKDQDVVELRFSNSPKGGVILKKVDPTNNNKPLPGTVFYVTDSTGAVIGSDNGFFTTGSDGLVTISNIEPGTTIIAREYKAPAGYKLDKTPQSVQVVAGKTHTLTFENYPYGSLDLVKVNEADHSERIPNVTFEFRRAEDGGLVDTATTGKTGRISLSFEAGSYYAVEVDCPKEFKLDSTPHYFTIRDGKTTKLTVANKGFSGILLHKVNSITGEGIPGVPFLLYDSKKNPIGEYTSDQRGYVYIDDLVESGRFYLRELAAAPGYELDKEYKTVYVKAGETIEVDWENTPITGQIQVYKYAAEENTVVGIPAGTPLPGAVYEISEARSGKVVDYITTDARGVAASKPLPLSRYKVREVTAPAFWQVDTTVFDETLEYSGQIIKISAYDKPAKLGVTITKRSNAEVLAGSQMRYDITVANTSNVPLENFFWHDRIPTDAARATVLTTGTYSARLNYRILYKTNYNDYRELASNLLTSNNYSFALNAIPMQAGEVVTDIYFDFGKVPVAFQSMNNPTVSVNVLATATNGYQLINRADVGGKYQGTWQTAQASWLTVIRKLTVTPPPTLPKTGY